MSIAPIVTLKFEDADIRAMIAQYVTEKYPEKMVKGYKWGGSTPVTVEVELISKSGVSVNWGH
jgi:hypothetical protein